MLYAPTMEDIKLQLKMFAPTLVYLSAGYTASSHNEQVPYATLNSLIVQNIGPTGMWHLLVLANSIATA